MVKVASSSPFPAGHAANVRADSSIRVSAIISALSYALDLTEGQPMGHSVRSCMIGMRLAAQAGLPASEQGDLYYALLLKDAGCSSNSSRLYHILNADDLRAKGDLKTKDWTRVGWESLHYALTHVGTGMPFLPRMRRLLQVAATQQQDSCDLVKIRCERGAYIAKQLGFSAAVASGIHSLDEHWNGRGYPEGLRKTEIPLFSRIANLSQTLDVFHGARGPDAAIDAAQDRSGAGLKTLLNLQTSGYGWNGSVGARFHATRKVELGFAWKSSTVILSHGSASGDANAQFAALGLSGVPSSFQYSAQVRNVLPQSALASVSWRVDGRWLLAFQADWVNWGNAFVNLPVTLTGGTNVAINGLVGSSTLVDGVPLNWKDQYSFHVGAERLLTERASLRFGYAHGNNPVPSSTLTPMTAAIMSNQISTGLVYNLGRSRLEGAYVFDPTAQSQVQQSGLLSGEYNNSTVRVGTQSFTLGYSVQF